MLEEVLLSEQCAEDQACAGIFNGLVTIGSHVSSRAFASFLRTDTGKDYTGAWLTLALIMLPSPSAELILTLLERLQAYASAMSPHPVHAGHKPEVGKMLGVAAMASKITAYDDAEKVAAAEAVEAFMAENLERAREMDNLWNEAHQAYRQQAEEVWELQMSPSAREHWAGRAHPMSMDAMAWDAESQRNGGTAFDEFLDHGRRMFVDHHIDARFGIDPKHEELSVSIVGNALRAVNNLKTRGLSLLDKVASCLDHRSDMVAKQAAKTLAGIAPHGQAERHLLDKLSRQLEDGGAAHKRAPAVTNATLKALLPGADNENATLSSEGMDTLLRLYLQQPVHIPTKPAHSLKTTVEICAAKCAESCNPFRKDHCREDCESACKHEHQVHDAIRPAQP